jgi:signal transduction histidine kinase
VTADERLGDAPTGPASEPTLEQTTLLFRQRRAIQMRFGAALAIGLAPLLAPMLGAWPPTWPLLGLALLLAALNAVYLADLRRLYRLRGSQVVAAARRSASVQAGLDLGVLTVLIHLTGGVENPLLLYYVFHVIIAGILLPYQLAFLFASLAVLLVLGMGIGELTGFLPHLAVPGFTSASSYANPTYVAGVLFTFASTVYLAAYLSSSISGELRKRQRQVLELNAALSTRAESVELANERLVRMDHSRATFLAIASHDLRAPLAAAITSLDAIVATSALGDRQRQMLRRSQHRLGGLIALADGLLDVSRIEKGELIPDRQAMQIADTVAATADELRPMAEAKGVELRQEALPDLPAVWGSPTRLRQVLINLIHNAVKFTPAGGVVALRALHAGDSVRVEVTDSGPGINPDDLSRVFPEDFFATNVKGPGAGLGLYIARRIVEAHGGQIRVASPAPETGRGSEFSFEIPVLRESAPESAPRMGDEGEARQVPVGAVREPPLQQ